MGLNLLYRDEFRCARCGWKDRYPQVDGADLWTPELCIECWRDDFWGRSRKTSDAARVRRFVAHATAKVPGTREL